MEWASPLRRNKKTTKNNKIRHPSKQMNEKAALLSPILLLCKKRLSTPWNTCPQRSLRGCLTNTATNQEKIWIELWVTLSILQELWELKGNADFGTERIIQKSIRKSFPPVCVFHYVEIRENLFLSQFFYLSRSQPLIQWRKGNDYEVTESLTSITNRIFLFKGDFSVPPKCPLYRSSSGYQSVWAMNRLSFIWKGTIKRKSQCIL